MGQVASNTRSPFSRSRRQQDPTPSASAFDSIFSNRPVSLAYVRGRTNSRASSHARRRSVLRRSDRPLTRRTQTGHQTRRFSIFLSRPVHAPFRRSNEQSRTHLTTTLDGVLDESLNNEATSHFCDVCSEHVTTDLDSHNQHALNHRQDNDYWSIERARIPWCSFCQIYFQSQSNYREHIMSVMRHNRRFAEAERIGVSETRVSRAVVPIAPVLINIPIPIATPPPALASELHPLAFNNYLQDIIVDVNHLHCAPCDRFFRTDEELREHQHLNGCNAVTGVYAPTLTASPEQDIPPLPPTRSNSIFSYESRQSETPSSIRPSIQSRVSYSRPTPRGRRNWSRSRSRTNSSWFNRPSDRFSSLGHSTSSESPPIDSRRPSFEEWLESTFQGSPPASLQTDIESTIASSSRSSLLSTAVRRARRVVAIYRPNSISSQGDNEEEMGKAPLPAKSFAYPCSICMGEDEELSALACGHVFGTKCLTKAIRSKKECPMCRKPASFRHLRRIFLT